MLIVIHHRYITISSKRFVENPRAFLGKLLKRLLECSWNSLGQPLVSSRSVHELLQMLPHEHPDVLSNNSGCYHKNFGTGSQYLLEELLNWSRRTHESSTGDIWTPPEITQTRRGDKMLHVELDHEVSKVISCVFLCASANTLKRYHVIHHCWLQTTSSSTWKRPVTLMSFAEFISPLQL